MSASVEDISPQPDPLILALHVAATLYMTGVIWTIQRITYPAFRFADRARFEAMTSSHGRTIPWIVAPAMLTELATGIVLILEGNAAWEFRGGPWSVFRNLLALSLWQLAIVWASTALVQAPVFARLRRGPDEDAIRFLIASNWIRTVGWTARAALVLVLLVMALQLGRTR